MINKGFAHLRLSSEYSISHGLLTIDKIVALASQRNIPAVALTDKSNMFGMVKFFNKCESSGIKPISGVSLKVIAEEDDTSYEFLCLAKNNDGHKNLMKAISYSHANLRFQQPVIEYEKLHEIKDNIFFILGGKESIAFEMIKSGRTENLLNRLRQFQKDLRDNMFLEVQSTNRPYEIEYFNDVLSISSDLDIPIIPTNDVMFGDIDDFESHETKVCINNGLTLSDNNRERNFSKEQFLKSSSEMSDLFRGFDGLISNSLELAKQCNVSIKTNKYYLPEYPVPKNYNFDSYIDFLAKKNLDLFLNEDLNLNKRKYYDRLSYELDQIKNMGFSSYFLIVYDFIEWSKKNDIPVGPGRGSGAGSLVAFSLGITALDPIEHGLLFERFLNPERLSMPDFDIDFCMEKRDKVIEYVSKKYGSDAVSQIATFGTMAARAVVRDVARAMGKPYALGDRISKMIPFAPNMTLERAKKEQPIFSKTINEDDEVNEVVDLAHKLEGIARNVGKHAGGVVIAPGSVSDFCPTYIDRHTSSIMTQYDKDDVEKIGLVKFDFLGLRTLTVIDKAIKSINSINEKKVDLSKIPLNDKNVYKLMSSGKTTAVFQLESTGMRDLIKRLKPSRFEEITALLALFRPGPLDSGMHDQFVDRKHGRSPVTYPHKLLEPVLKETYGVILYQEQVMESARVLANFSLGEADILRRAMGKKKVEEMEQQRKFFKKGCLKNNINEKTAEKIFDLIEKFAGYGFNKSHSAAYALISYQTAYLKTYYPEHLMAAALSTELGNTDKIKLLKDECEAMGTKVLSPNINSSKKFFYVNKKKEIDYGLGAIKGVADSFIENLIRTRESAAYSDMWEFSSRTDVKMGGKKSLEALAYSGAFDSITPNRSIAISCVNDILKSSSSLTNQSSGDLFAGITNTADPYERYFNIEEISFSDFLEYEKKAFGYYFSGHPVMAISTIADKLSSTSIIKLNINSKKAKIVCLVNSVRQIRDRKGKPLTFMNLSDGTGTMDGIVSSELYENSFKFIKEGKIIVVSGSIEFDEYRSREKSMDMFRMRVSSITEMDDELTLKITKVIVNIEKSNFNSLESFSDAILSINESFWTDGKCLISAKIKQSNSEAMIDLGHKFKFAPTVENITFLEDMLGKNAIDI